jgi:hypothetical protein
VIKLFKRIDDEIVIKSLIAALCITALISAGIIKKMYSSEYQEVKTHKTK